MDWMDKVFTVWKALISLGVIGLIIGLFLGSMTIVKIFFLGLTVLVLVWLALLFTFF